MYPKERTEIVNMQLFVFLFFPLRFFCRKYSRRIIPGFTKEQKMGPQRESRGTKKRGTRESGLPIEVGRKKDESVPWMGKEWLV